MGKILDEINFFGATDRKGKKAGEAITSTYPAFYFSTQLDELIEETEKQERVLRKGLVPPSEVPYVTADIEKNKKRIQEIEQNYPRLNDKERDEVWGVYKDLAKDISDSMFTRTEMKQGFADAHEEARRMSEPLIPIKGKEKFFHNMGIKATGGKISRNDASRAYKIIGKVLGENTNVEKLRKDQNTGTFKLEKTLAELIKG